MANMNTEFLLQAADSVESPIAVLDSAAAATSVEQVPTGIEEVMLAESKLPVVLAVVLFVWFGILLLLFRTEKRLARVEKKLKEDV